MGTDLKRGSSIGAFWILLIVLAGLSGCVEFGDRDTIEVTDPTGRELKLDGVPERVITLTPALTEIVIGIGAEGLLVGADSASVAENPKLDLGTVSTWEGLDAEKVVELSPDVVIIDRTLDITGSNFNTIISLSIPVYRVFPEDFEAVVRTIDGIGELLGRAHEAKVLTDGMLHRYGSIIANSSLVPSAGRPTVLYVTYYDTSSDPWVGTSSTFSGDLIRTAGGRSAIEDDAGVVIQVSVETIIDADPDVIITSQSSVWPTRSRSLILSENTWKDIAAVKEEKVFDIDGDLIDRTGPRLIDGLEEVHAVLYP